MQILPYNKWLRLAVLLCLLFATVSLALSLLLPRLLDLNSYKTQLVAIVQKQINREVRLGNASFTWLLGPSFHFSDLSITDRDNRTVFLSARTISFRLALLPLLNKRIELREILLEEARVTLTRNREGQLNIHDLLQPSADEYDLQLKGIRVRNGTLFWRDMATPGAEAGVTLSGINLSLDKPRRGKKSSFKLAAILEGAAPGSISLNGSFKLPKSGELLTATDIDAKADLNQVEYWRIWPYLERFIPFKSPGGTVSLTLALKGRWKDLQGKAAITLRSPRLDWPAVFRSTVSPKQLQLKLNLKQSSTMLDMTDLQLAFDGFSIKGTVRLSDLGSKDPSISVKAVSERFDYLNVKSYIPFGIIADDAAYFIENRIRGGIFKLDNGTLNGRFSQLARFGVGDNANALYIIGTAEQASIQYGEKTPTFRQIKGTLEMKGRDFNLIGMSGLFGAAPFTLDGQITEYATEGVPSHYPFSMQISPRPAEVAWLAEYAGAEELRFEGNNTILKLHGDGPTAAYRVSGEWLLNTASYSYPSAVNKPAGMANTLLFNAVLGREATRFTSVTYQLPPLRVTGNGLLRYSTPTPYLAFDLETNQFQLDRQLPVLPDWKEYQLNGLAQAHLLGAGDPRSISSMQFSGNVRLSGFSFKPHPSFAPVTNISTRIDFKGTALKTSSMAIRYGSTSLQVSGRINNLANPEAELYITSPELNPVDFGLPAADKPTPIKLFSAHLALKDDLLTIRNASGRLPKSVISASGTVNTAGTPDFKLRIASTFLDIDEIIPLLAPARPADNTNRPAPAPFHLQAHITAENGSYRGSPLSLLTAYINTEAGVLHLKGLNASFLGGRLSLQGYLTRTEGQPPRWNASFLLEQARAGDLLALLGIVRELKGKTMVQGTLTAVGDELLDIKKTANGSITLAIDRGVLKRFNSLSKVISIINVSQLLRFSLPDMSRDGMPFNQITATIGVKNGILTTQDFFIDSNVMHVTSVGSIDLVRETLDMTIGVQPLQTVDQIVSRIPVVGWILSGGDGSLITTYFEAKGSWETPDVTAIPVQSMASGTLDIFRRVFELPVRLFTDSGEVILGNRKERPKAEPAQPHKKGAP